MLSRRKPSRRRALFVPILLLGLSLALPLALSAGDPGKGSALPPCAQALPFVPGASKTCFVDCLNTGERIEDCGLVCNAQR